MHRRVPLALLLVLLAPSVLAAPTCVTALFCARYETRANDAWIEGHAWNGMVVGAGQHGTGPFIGTEAHFFAPGGTYLFVYEGQWMGADRTHVGAAYQGTTVFGLYMDARATSYPSAYHCTSLGWWYYDCKRGLP